MSFIDAIEKELKGESMRQLAKAIGAKPKDTRSAVASALPILLGALTQNASAPKGAASLLNALTKDHAKPLNKALKSLGGMEGLVSALSSQTKAKKGKGKGKKAASKAVDGLGILGHLLGKKQQRAVNAIVKQSGLDVGQVEQLLPALAPMVMSSLGSVQMNKGMDALGLSKFLRKESKKLAGGKSNLLVTLLDTDKNGIGIDDLAKVGKIVQDSGVLKKLFK